MIYSFISRPDMLVRTADGRNCVFQEDITFRGEDGSMWRIPAGAATDWASTPAITWGELPPFGNYARACAVHDAAYRGTLERQTVDGQWLKAMLPKAEADLLLLDIMRCDGVDVVKREAIYEGVKRFGQDAFDADRANLNAS